MDKMRDLDFNPALDYLLNELIRIGYNEHHKVLPKYKTYDILILREELIKNFNLIPMDIDAMINKLLIIKAFG